MSLSLFKSLVLTQIFKLGYVGFELFITFIPWKLYLFEILKPLIIIVLADVFCKFTVLRRRIFDCALLDQTVGKLKHTLANLKHTS